MTIGDRIEERRKAVGIKSQAALARRSEIPQTTMNGLIKREYRWSPHLPRIARELGTTVDYLVGDTDNPDAGAPAPRPAPMIQYLMLPVALPSENALARMFEGLLRTIDRSAPLGEQAQLLARRLPIGLSQLQDLMPDQLQQATAEAQSATLATLHPELR